MGMKVGINGFGRIGRLVLRLGMERPDIEFVGINSHSQTPDYMAYLLKYDSVHGRYQGEVSWDGDDLIVDGHRIRVFLDRELLDLGQISMLPNVDLTLVGLSAGDVVDKLLPATGHSGEMLGPEDPAWAPVEERKESLK